MKNHVTASPEQVEYTKRSFVQNLSELKKEKKIKLGASKIKTET